MKKNYLKLIGFVSIMLTFHAFGQGTFNVPEIMYYKFDQTGTTVQNSANPGTQGNGTIVGTSLTQSGIGQFGTALTGTGQIGSSNYINTNWPTNLTGDWTMSFWLDMAPQSSSLKYFIGDANAGSFRVFAGGVAPPNGIVMRSNSLTDIEVNNVLGSGPKVIHIVYVASTGVSKAYVDGVLVNTVNQTPNLTISSASNLGVGSYGAASNDVLDGKMDEFRLYSRALDATEIGLTYNQPLPFGLVCGVITNAGFNNAQPTSVDFTWNHGVGNDDYKFEYGVAGFTPGSGFPTLGTITGTTKTETLTNLAVGTTYHVYVTETCNSGNDEYVLGPLSFMNDYCGVSTTYTGDRFSAVSSIGAVANVAYSASSQPAGSYANETAQNFVSYETQTFTMNTSYVGGGNGVNIWIDWDKDLTFDASELVGSLADANADKTFSITVPVGTAQGDYRMRVRSDYGSTANPPACGNTNYGSTIDFTLTIATPPTCLSPTNLTVSNITATTLDLGWTENNTATEWQLEYGPHGFVQGTGQLQSGINTNPYSFNFTAGSDYDFYVRSICAVGDTSYWSMPYEYTYCDVSTLYGEFLTSVSSVGAVTNISYTASTQPAGSYANETTQTFESYETQTFDINTNYSSGTNTTNIWIDWDHDMVFDASELVATSGSAAAHNMLISVPVGTPQGDYRMRVRAQWGTGVNPPPCGSVNYGSTVDFTLSIVSPPTCLSPTALAATNITSTSAELAWTENSGATTWNIEYGVAGFTQGNGTPANGITTNPYPITITPNTHYEFYVQSICSPTDLSAWAGPFTFTNAYCDYVITSTSPQHISSFITTGAIADINNPNSGPGTTTNGYSDFTNIVMDAYETQMIDFSIVTSNVSTYGVTIYVDWNDDYIFSSSEKLYNSGGYMSMPMSGSFTIPQGATVGQHRMRVIADYLNGAPLPCSGSSAEAEDYTLNIIAPPTCLPPMTIAASNIATNSIELSWVELNSATSWNIQYGMNGFTVGNGTTVSANSNPYTVTGLNPSANYDFYVQSVCSSSDSSAWRGPFSVYTACGIAVAPFYEGFNHGVQPQCWDNLSSDPSTSINNFWKFSGAVEAGALANGKASGTFAFSDGDTPKPDSMMLISPEIDISQLTTPYLSFEWFSNNTNYPGDNIPMIVSVFDGVTWHLLDTLKGDSPDWEFVNYDLSAYSNNTIQIRFMTNQTIPVNSAYLNDILLDEFRIDDCISLGGQDGSLDVCRLDNTVNLNDNLIVKPNGGGEWSFPGQPGFLSDSIFTITYLPAGTHEVYYVERFVCYDTTVATINIFNTSSAGTGGTLSVCKNEPIDLYSGLAGNVDFGGDWYDYTSTLLPNSQPKAQPIPGQYNYMYIADNGVCPADTAIVEVGVRPDCDFLSLSEELFAEISVYPNPATNQLNIVNPSNTSSLKVEMLDMNGRIVLVENKALNNASEATLVIEHLERGIYTLRVYNNEGQKTFKIVKQ